MHHRRGPQEAGNGGGAGRPRRPFRAAAGRRAGAHSRPAAPPRLGPVLRDRAARGDSQGHGRYGSPLAGEEVRRAGTCASCAVLAVFSTLLAAPASPPIFDPTRSDPRAIVIADLVMAALGGRRACEQTRFVYFAFAVERDGKRVAYRTHLWYRWEGRLRYETRGKDGVSLLVLLNVDTRQGEAYRLPAQAPAAGGGLRGQPVGFSLPRVD